MAAQVLANPVNDHYWLLHRQDGGRCRPDTSCMQGWTVLLRKSVKGWSGSWCCGWRHLGQDAGHEDGQDIPEAGAGPGQARHFSKAESRKQLESLERVAAAGSDGVYRRARLEEMVFKVRGQMQYLDGVEVFTVD
jgi:hypothetical protein